MKLLALLLALLAFGYSTPAQAAFPVQAGVANSSEATPAAIHDAVSPGSISAGQLMLLMINFVNASNTDPTASGVTGWTALCDSTNSDTSTSSATFWFYKFASGSETDFTYSSSASVESMTRWFRYTGAHASTPPECVASEFIGDFANSNSLTVSWGAEDNLWYSAFSKYNGNDVVTVYPTDYSSYQFSNTSGQFLVQVGHAARELNTDTQNPTGFTFDGAGNGVEFTIAIRPAGAGGPAPARRRETMILP